MVNSRMIPEMTSTMPMPLSQVRGSLRKMALNNTMLMGDTIEISDIFKAVELRPAM